MGGPNTLFLSEKAAHTLLVVQQVERTSTRMLDVVHGQVPAASQPAIDEARALMDKAYKLVVGAIATPLNLEGLN